MIPVIGTLVPLVAPNAGPPGSGTDNGTLAPARPEGE